NTDAPHHQQDVRWVSGRSSDSRLHGRDADDEPEPVASAVSPPNPHSQSAEWFHALHILRCSPFSERQVALPVQASPIATCLRSNDLSRAMDSEQTPCAARVQHMRGGSMTGLNSRRLPKARLRISSTKRSAEDWSSTA